MEKMYWKKVFALLLASVLLSGIVACQGGKKNISSSEDVPPGIDANAENRIVASMGTVNINQKQAVNYLKSLDPDIVTRALDRQGGLEDLVRGVTLRMNVVNRAIKDNWQTRADIKIKIEQAQRKVLYRMYITEKTRPPAGYPDDATVAKVYADNSQRLAAAGNAVIKPLQEIAPLLRQRLREKQTQENEKNYIKNLVSSNPVAVDVKMLIDFVKLPQEQKQQQRNRLQQPVARMGNRGVSLEMVLNSLRSMDQAQQLKLLNNAGQLQQYLNRQALELFVLNEAVAEKFNTRPVVRNQMDQARFQVLYITYLNAWSAPQENYPDAALVEENYRKNLGNLTGKDRYLLAKIILANSGDAATDGLKARQIAAAARKGADFSALARQYSQEPETAKAGGQVGWINTEVLLPELSQAIRGNQPGAIIGPIHNKWGWQIIKILDHQPAYQKTLEEARPALVAALRKQRAADKEKQILEQLVASEPIAVDSQGLQQLRHQLTG